MGKNQRERKAKKVAEELQGKTEISKRQKEKFQSVAYPLTRYFVTIVLSILLLVGGHLILRRSVNNQTPPPAPNNIVVIETDKGKIKILLNPEAAPKTVENFKLLAERGYYNGLTFHRVIDDFMIQGGDPKGDGTGGESAWGGTFADEINPTALGLDQATIDSLTSQGYNYSDSLPSEKVTVGALAMANSGANTNGSQFFIVSTQDQPHLNGRHTVFGMVSKGMDIVNSIKQGDKMNRVYLENNAT